MDYTKRLLTRNGIQELGAAMMPGAVVYFLASRFAPEFVLVGILGIAFNVFIKGVSLNSLSTDQRLINIWDWLMRLVILGIGVAILVPPSLGA